MTARNPLVLINGTVQELPSGDTVNGATGGAGGGTTTNPEVIKFDGGTTEGVDLYTFDGSATKTIEIKSGNGISMTKAAGSITIESTGGGGSSITVGQVVAFANGLALP